MGTKESVYIRKEINSHRTGLGHQHGRRFIVLEHQYGAVTSGETLYREIQNHVYIKLYHVIKFALFSALTVVMISTLE